MASNVRRLERKPRSKKLAAVPPGLHAATLELEVNGTFRARLATGELVPVGLAEGVSPALAKEALRDRRTVLVSASARSVLVLGALQTQPSAPSDALRVRAPSVELEGEEGLVLRSGKARLVLEPDGSIRLVGDAMTMRIAQVLRVLAANVELP